MSPVADVSDRWTLHRDVAAGYDCESVCHRSNHLMSNLDVPYWEFVWDDKGGRGCIYAYEMMDEGRTRPWIESFAGLSSQPPGSEPERKRCRTGLEWSR